MWKVEAIVGTFVTILNRIGGLKLIADLKRDLIELAERLEELRVSL
ncbi:MAG: hypothetical protein Kow00111_15110 [Thermincola ferriacetica]